MPVIQKGLQYLLQVHDARHLAAIQDVHVQWNATLQVGLAEQRFHQDGRVDVAALRLQNQPDLFRRLVADILQQRQLPRLRSEEHTSELQSLMRISYAVFRLKKTITQ